jgi:hypothetical protein
MSKGALAGHQRQMIKIDGCGSPSEHLSATVSSDSEGRKSAARVCHLASLQLWIEGTERLHLRQVALKRERPTSWCDNLG